MKVTSIVHVLLLFLSAEGLRNTENDLFIIGGRNSTIEKHPYQASITTYGAFVCSGTVLNHKWVLTSATCIACVMSLLSIGGLTSNTSQDRMINSTSSAYNIRFLKEDYEGRQTSWAEHNRKIMRLNTDRNLSTESAYEQDRYTRLRDTPSAIKLRVASDSYASGGEVYTGRNVTVHPKYSEITMDYNIALVKINGSFEYSNKLKPIKISKKALPSGQKAIISGWGRTSKYGPDSLQIKELDVQVIKKEICKTTYSGLNSRAFCAGSVDYGPCFEDSADPLVVRNKLYGTFSHGQSCFGSYYPSLYNNLPKYRGWILDNIKQ